MPLLANKVYVLNKTKKDRKDDVSVLFHPLTNEICENAEELERKIFLYNQKIWTCKITGQINLTFKEAQKSEQGCSKMLKNSFMKCYEHTVLQYVHHSRENLDNVIHKAWTQIHEEYCVNEPVMIKLTTPKQLLLKGVVVKVDRDAPQIDNDTEVSPSKMASDASSSDKENTKKKVIPVKKNYHYSVKLFEMDKLVNDIPAETIERTLRPPSKDQIRMFIRAHAVRHSGKASNPWVVDEELVKKYKLPNTESEFICDKLKTKEISRTAEIQMYSKLMEDAEKKNGDTTLDLSNGNAEAHKRPRRSVDGSGSKKLKQMTLLDMRTTPPAAARPATKIKSPFASPNRSMPPLAQQLLRLMKENQTDHMVNQLMLKCCQYTDAQIAKFPDLIRVPIKEKKEKLELKKKLKNMSQAERDVFMAERRSEQRQLQREKKKVEVTRTDDADMVHNGTLADGELVPMIDSTMTHDQWARLVSLSEFVRSFKGLLGPASVATNNGELEVSDMCRAVTGSCDRDQAILADLVCLFLKPLLQDSELRQRRELGVSLGEMPVTACTAGELLKLVLLMDDDSEDASGAGETAERDLDCGETTGETPGETVASLAREDETLAHNNAIAGPICERLAHCEMAGLTMEEKIAVLELLQGRILELDIISSFIDDSQREATEAYKRRQTEVKEMNDRLKEVRITMGEMRMAMAAADAAVSGASEEKMDEDIPQSVRRRLSLELRVKETEERDKRVELERQFQRLEKEEVSLRKQIDNVQQAYTSATIEARQLMRVQSLGTDRLYRRYWHFRTAPDAIYLEIEVASQDASLTTEWRMYASLETLSALIEGLDERGVRENALKKEVQAILPGLRDRIEKKTKIKVDDDETINEKTPEEEREKEESFLMRGFKDELRETELNIRQGSLGGVDDFNEWERRLSEAADCGVDLGPMKEALVAVFLGVHERFWNLPMKTASARSEYLVAVTEAETASRLCVLQSFLDVCVCWSKSASDDKCRVCHKSHKEDAMLLCDGCNRAYHTFCLRPPLRTVPDGEWLCPRCKPRSRAVETVGVPVKVVVAATTTTTTTTTRQEPVEEMDNEELEEMEVCCVCKGSEQGMGKCVSCGCLYHAECHEPPLRHMRRTGWYCASCRVDEAANHNHNQHHQRAAKTRHNYRATTDDDDDDGGGVEEAEDCHNGDATSKKKKNKTKKRVVVAVRDDNEEKDDEDTIPPRNGVKKRVLMREDSESEEEVIQPRMKNRRCFKNEEEDEEKTHLRTKNKRSFKEEEDEEVATQPKIKNKRSFKNEEEDEEEKTRLRTKNKRSFKEEEDEEDEVSQPRKKNKRKATNDDDDDKDERMADDTVDDIVKKRGRKRAPPVVVVPSSDKNKKVIKSLLKQMNNHKSAWPFRDAVDKEDVPDYYTIITTPMHLALMTDKCKQCLYTGITGLETFLGDVALMFDNAELYNETDSEIMHLAKELETYFVSIYNKSDLMVVTASEEGDEERGGGGGRRWPSYKRQEK